ncbi:MAG: radical SAM protein [Candidatus Omnitrophota bacterium]|nr:B12-binding domain-containing radical SAM protein [Candidatus Omnitrophota bacterium]MBU1929366.1 B12-binding domain-containing radical SAM protein [Candidatus Omnitrophota bacterium]MBU2035253.1 B12-binding domain-containing radical SAM protein [Candidatus Omnitrophota bacterium]MBU2257993.1 B12-binding domain-containing radical SAM protein [Candidatus Omnitrophota bacterium]
MNILFIVPPADLSKKNIRVDRVYGCNYGYDYKPPIHLLSLATIARDLGFQVRLLDCPAEGYNAKKFINYIKDHKKNIDLVVFFTVWLAKEIDLLAGSIVSGILKDARIVFTGAYPTWKPDVFLKNNNNIVIRGEPEGAFEELIQYLKINDGCLSKISGLSFSREGKSVDNGLRRPADINKIPIPDRRFLKGNYFFNRIKYFPATVACFSRGCSYGCTYCAPQALDQAIELEFSRFNLGKPPLRLRSADQVINEFKEISVLGYQGVEICDNQFLWDSDRIAHICDGIKNLKLKWICNARADYIKDEEVLRLMKDAGCELVYVGTESFNQEILNDINKGVDLAQNYRAVDLLRRCGIEPEVSVLLGASGLETREKAIYSVSEAKKMKTKFVHYSIAFPFPNTKLYKTARENGWIKDNEFIPLDNTRDAILDLPYIQAKMLKIIVKKCYRQQYISIDFIIKQVFYCHSVCEFKYKIKALLRFLKYLFNSL